MKTDNKKKDSLFRVQWQEHPLICCSVTVRAADGDAAIEKVKNGEYDPGTAEEDDCTPYGCETKFEFESEELDEEE